MKEIAGLVEEMAYLDEDIFIDWYGELEEYFYPLALDDVGRLDNSAYDYLISLNRNNESLSSDGIDLLIKREDVYFMEIIISRDKLLASQHFWQYPKGSGFQLLNVSEDAFLSGQEAARDKFLEFAGEKNLLLLKDEDLRELVPHEGEMVSIYYKYFDDEYESTTDIPY